MIEYINIGDDRSLDIYSQLIVHSHTILRYTD
jgi:hypothetical protein